MLTSTEGHQLNISIILSKTMSNGSCLDGIKKTASWNTQLCFQNSFAAFSEQAADSKKSVNRE